MRTRNLLFACSGLFAVAGCNLAIGLSKYDFEGGGAASSSTSSSTATNQTGGGGQSTSTSSASGGNGGSTTTRSTTGQGGTGGGQGGSAPLGTVDWSLGISTQSTNVTAIGVDPQGNVYVTGSYDAPGGNPLVGCTGLTGTGGTTRGFLIKLDATGQCIGGMSFGATGTTAGTALAISPSGEITLAGTYTATFMMPGADTLPAPAGKDAFVVRYPAGFDPSAPAPATWFRRFGDAGDQTLSDLTIADDGNVWVTGWYKESLVVMAQPPLVKTGSIYQETGFVLRLGGQSGAPDNQAVRLFATTTSNDVEVLAVAAKPGEIALGARASGGVDFGEGPELNKGFTDGFFARYAPPALPFLGGAWLSDQYDQIVRDVAYDAQGRLFLAGNFWGSIDFHNGATLSQTATQRAFLAQVAADGTAQKAIQLGDMESPANLRCAALPGGGGLVFAGMLKGTVTLPGTPQLSVTTQANDVIVGRIDSALANGIWLHVYGDTLEQGADALAIGPDGSIVVAGHFRSALPFDANQKFNDVAMFVAKIKP